MRLGLRLGLIKNILRRTIISVLSPNSLSFSRGSTALVHDFERKVNNVEIDELRIRGYRREKNVIPDDIGQDLTNPAWQKFGAAGGALVTTTKTTATYVAAGGAAFGEYGSLIYPVFNDGYQGRELVVSFDLYGIAGETIEARINMDGGEDVAETFIITEERKRCSIPLHTQNGATPAWGYVYFNRKLVHTVTTVTITKVMLDDVTAKTNKNPVDYNDGINPDYYDYENGNTVAANIVTELAGSTIDPNITDGALIEPERLNYITRSHQFDNWTKSGAIVTPDTELSPNGLVNADVITFDNDNEYVRSNTLSVESGINYCDSIYAKDNTGAFVFRMTSPTSSRVIRAIIDTDAKTITLGITSGSVTAVRTGIDEINVYEGYTRYYLIGSFSLGTMGCMILREADPTHTSATVWGAQIEKGEFPTSLILTEGSILTRSPDKLSFLYTDITTEFTFVLKKVKFQSDGAYQHGAVLWSTQDSRGEQYTVRVIVGAAFGLVMKAGGIDITMEDTYLTENFTNRMGWVIDQQGANVKVTCAINNSIVYSDTVAGVLDHSDENKIWIGSDNGTNFVRAAFGDITSGVPNVAPVLGFNALEMVGWNENEVVGL